MNNDFNDFFEVVGQGIRSDKIGLCHFCRKPVFPEDWLLRKMIVGYTPGDGKGHFVKDTLLPVCDACSKRVAIQQLLNYYDSIALPGDVPGMEIDYTGDRMLRVKSGYEHEQ